MTMKTTLFAAALITAPGLAQAVTFDFAGPLQMFDQGALTFTDAASGVTASVTAGTHTGANAPFATETDCGICVEQHSNGISVLGEGDDTHELDDDEWLRLTFSAPVLLDAVWFNAGWGWDEFDMAVDNVDLGITTLFGDDRINRLPVDNLVSSYLTDRIANFGDNGGPLFGRTFTFYTDDNNDDYKVAGVRFSTIPVASSVSAVPLPAGMTLVLGGLGLFGAMRLRRRES